MVHRVLVSLGAAALSGSTALLFSTTAHAAEDPSSSPSPASSVAASAGSDPAPTASGPVKCTTFDDQSLDISLAQPPFPSTIVAGGDWQEFTLAAGNRGDKEIRHVASSVTIGWHPGTSSQYLEVQLLNPHSGKWKDVPDDAESTWHLAEIDLPAHTETDLRLRVHAAADAPEVPDASGLTMVAGSWDNGDGTCGNTDGDQAEFTLTAAASGEPSASPSAGGGTEQTSGGTGGTPSPSRSTGAAPQPSTSGKVLAETGTAPALPALALLSGAAVTAGAGALALARRRTGV